MGGASDWLIPVDTVEVEEAGVQHLVGLNNNNYLFIYLFVVITLCYLCLLFF